MTPREWDGRPQNPDRDGWHWLAPAIDPTLPPGAYRWHAPPRADVVGMWDGAYPKDMVRRGYTYLAPCLTPEEHAALLAERDAARAVAVGLYDERDELRKLLVGLGAGIPAAAVMKGEDRATSQGRRAMTCETNTTMPRAVMWPVSFNVACPGCEDRKDIDDCDWVEDHAGNFRTDGAARFPVCEQCGLQFEVLPVRMMEARDE